MYRRRMVPDFLSREASYQCSVMVIPRKGPTLSLALSLTINKCTCAVTGGACAHKLLPFIRPSGAVNDKAFFFFSILSFGRFSNPGVKRKRHRVGSSGGGWCQKRCTVHDSYTGANMYHAVIGRTYPAAPRDTSAAQYHLVSWR